MKYGYNYISIPYDIEGAAVTETFNNNLSDDVNPAGPYEPYIYRWQPSGLDIVAGIRFSGSWVSISPTDPDPELNTELNGTGFYIYSWGYNNVLDVDTANVPEYGDQANENWIDINLEQGRNLVGNPYLKNVAFSKILICKDTLGFDTTADPDTGDPCDNGTSLDFANITGTGAVSNGWVSGEIVNYVRNNTTADLESCVSGDCLAQLRPWWGQFVYLLLNDGNYIMAVPKP
ncbi:MAG: hypothetical protein ACYSTI_14570 [Planctomycetota bacterium]|jgi:hypothetical protein